MTTTKQQLANRRNAKKSTGPKTPGGKLMSSKNAITFGIFSTSPLLPSENAQEFEVLKKDITAVFPPIDAMAVSLVERIVLAILRQQRLRVAEAAKLQISMTPAIMVEEISDELRLVFNHRLKAEGISEKQEESYQFWVDVLEEINQINIKTAAANLGQLSLAAPKSFDVLKQDAVKDPLGYDAFMKNPAKVVASLQDTKKHAENFILLNTTNHIGYGIAQQMKFAKLMPHSNQLSLFCKYQVQLDTDLYRAIDAYKKHVVWRTEHMEVEVKEVQEPKSEALTA